VNRRAALFLLLYVAAVLYLSLYPWRFVPSSKVLGWIPLNTRRTILDAFLNVVFYMPLGAAAFLSFRRRAVGFIAALVFGTLVSFSVEWAQLSIPGRFGNLTDLTCNSLGTLLGMGVAFIADSALLTSQLRVFHAPKILLLGLWALWQAFVLLPQYGFAFDLRQEVVGILILALLATHRGFRVTAILLLIWLAVDELRPFQFRGPPQPFGWLPFESWFVGALESYYETIFEKLFLYTAILWTERRSGLRWIWALVVPGAILFVGELAQCYLPGRTPETTDLVLLAAGAVLLNLAELHNKDSA
jgi:VanZ family protein